MSSCCIILCVLLGTLLPLCQHPPADAKMHWGVMDPDCTPLRESDAVARLPHPHAYQPYPRPARYPGKAIRDNVHSGAVSLRVQVGEAGYVTAVQVLSASPAGYFEQSAINAVRSQSYEPHRASGREVCFEFTREIAYRLKVEAP
jgi:TonB family protein